MYSVLNQLTVSIFCSWEFGVEIIPNKMFNRVVVWLLKTRLIAFTCGLSYKPACFLSSSRKQLKELSTHLARPSPLFHYAFPSPSTTSRWASQGCGSLSRKASSPFPCFTESSRKLAFFSQGRFESRSESHEGNAVRQICHVLLQLPLLGM